MVGRAVTAALAWAALTWAALAGALAWAVPAARADAASEPFLGGGSSGPQYIIGGDAVSRDAYPWMTALLSRTDDWWAGQFCGGSLISPQFVLTAAHCLSHLTANGTVAVATHDLGRKDGQLAGIDARFGHPRYDSDGDDYDIALLRLDRPIDGVRPVRLSTVRTSAGTTATVIGWGDVDPDDATADYPTRLRGVSLPVVSAAECQAQLEPYFGENSITSRMVCAGAMAGGRDSCQGDSGGPLFVRGRDGDIRQIGVVSFGEGCGRTGVPGVYADVVALGDFIRRTLMAEGRLADVAVTRTQAAVAGALDRLGPRSLGSALGDLTLDLMTRTVAEQRLALETLAPGTVFDQTRFARDAAALAAAHTQAHGADAGGMAAALTDSLTVFAGAGLATGGGRPGAATVGLGYRDGGHWNAGGAVSVIAGRRDDGLRRVDSRGVAATLFGSLPLAGARLAGYAGYGADGHDTDRTIILGDDTRRAEGAGRDRWLAIGVEAGLPRHWGALTVTPLTRFDAVRVAADGSRETGGGAAGVDTGDHLAVSAVAGVGGEVAWGWRQGDGWIRPRARLVLEHEFAGDEAVSVRFHDAAGTGFTLRQAVDDPTWLAVGAGIAWWAGPAGGLQLDWRTDLGRDDAHGHRLGLSGRVVW